MVVYSMECLLCSMWAKMPYGKRYTTPTSVGETEGALVIGYWVATRQPSDLAVRLCERHISVVNILDNQEEARKKVEAQRQEAQRRHETQRVIEQTQDQNLQQRLAEVHQRKEQLIASAPVVPTQPLPSYQGAFTLGPGPLGNPNTLIAEQMAQPLPPTIETGLTVPPLQVPGQPIVNPNLPQAPIQGAALIDAPCLFCKKMVMTGEVHNCPMAAGTSGLNPI
jgi:hypothetical protein